MRRATTGTSHRSALSTALIAAVSATAMALTGVVPANAAEVDPLTTYVVDAPSLTALRAAVGPLAGERTEILPSMEKAIVELTAAEARRLDGVSGVSVAADDYLFVADTQDNAPWGIDRLDQTTPSNGAPTGSNQYWYPDSAGSGVRVYVVDSGVKADHPDLNGRVIAGYDAINAVEGPTDDCNGHGTAVASAAAGTSYGVAKLATIVPVQAASCTGSASTSAIIRGLDWIAATHPVGTPATINISLGAMDRFGSAGFTALESSVADIISKGFFVAIAAGNDSSSTSVKEACQFSPARVPAAFTVGAADGWAGGLGIEGRSEFSNAGSCVDAFAPGTAIMTASANGADTYRNGTSFASPIVAGLAALHLGENVDATPAQTTAVLLAAAQKDALIDNASRVLSSNLRYDSAGNATIAVTASPNLMVQTPAQVPDHTAPVSGFRYAGRTPSTLKYEWSEAVDVRLRINGGLTPTQSVDVRGTSYTFTGLADGTTYQVEAWSLTDGLLGPAGADLYTKTGEPQRITPAAVQNLTATLIPASKTIRPKARLAWTAPADLGMTPTTDYVIQWSKNGGVWTTYADGVSTAKTWATYQLGADSAYAFRVFAKNSGGTGPGAAVSLTVGHDKPGSVRDLAVAVTGPTATLTWAAAADPGFTPTTDYVIQWSKSGGAWTTYADTVSVATKFTTPNLSGSSSYAFRVAAVNSFGTGSSSAVTAVTTRERPGAVTEITTSLVPATSTAAAKIRLGWTAPADTGFTPVTDYFIQWSKGDGVWTTYADGKSAALSFTTPSLGTAPYSFRVFAVNSYGTGPGTVVGPLTTRDRPGAVSGLSAVSSTTTGVLVADLQWTAPTISGFSPVTDYVIQWSKNGGVWTTYADGKRSDLRYDTPALDHGTSYSFRVFAVNSYGTGPGTVVAFRTP